MKSKNQKTYVWYAQELNMSLRTAKRKGKKELERMLKEKKETIKEQLLLINENVEKKSHNAFCSNVLELDEKKFNEETRKRGIRLLNRAIGALEEVVLESKDMPIYQRSCIMVGIVKTILGSK